MRETLGKAIKCITSMHIKNAESGRPLVAPSGSFEVFTTAEEAVEAWG